MNEPLPVASPLSGVLWTWVVPMLLFALSSVATWLLYRHFARQKPKDS
jgi:membrane protein implicated in regulation of membrane protease activity